MATSSPVTLSLLVDEFCTATRDSAVDDITTLLLSNTHQLIDVVTSAGPFLTSETPEKRISGVVLLCEILRRCGTNLSLAPSTCTNLLEFFQSRLENDWECALACLRGIELIITLHTSQLDKPTIVTATKAILGTHPVQTLAQPLRMVIFQTCLFLVRVHPNYLTDDGKTRWFAHQFRNAMEGEKDPRCLLICLECAGQILKNRDLGGQEWVEDIFDVVSMYFPVMFRPPPGDPYGITHDGLVQALNSVFQGDPHMTDCVVPMILERLRMTSTEASEARVESLRALSTNVPYFGAAALAPYANDIRQILMSLVLSPDEDHLVHEAMECLKALVRVFAPSDAVVDASESPLWAIFVDATLKTCFEAFQAAIDSMAARGAGQVMVAIADAHGRGLSSVLTYGVPALITGGGNQQEEEEEGGGGTGKDIIQAPPPLSRMALTTTNASRRVVALDFLVKILKCLRSDVTYVDVANPVRPFATILLNCLSSQLAFAHTLHFADDELGVGVLALEGMEALVSRSKQTSLFSPQALDELFAMVKDVYMDALMPQSPPEMVLACIACLRRTRPDIALEAVSNNVQWTTKHLVATAAIITSSSTPEMASHIIRLIVQKRNDVQDRQCVLQTLCTVAKVVPVATIKDMAMTMPDLFDFVFAGSVSDGRGAASELLYILQTKADEETNFILTRQIETKLCMNDGDAYRNTALDARHEAILLGSRRGALQHAQQLCRLLCTMVGSGRALASLLNKLPDGGGSSGGGDGVPLDQVVTVVLDALSETRDVNKLGWVYKALAMRSHGKADSLGGMVIQQVIGKDSLEAANSIELLMRADEYGLDKTSFARVSPVYRQRAFETMFPILLGGGSSSNNLATLVAMGNMVAGTPLTVLMTYGNIEAVITAMARCMSEAALDMAPLALRQSTLRAVSLFVNDLERTDMLLTPHITTIVTFLLSCTVLPMPMTARMQALRCLQILPTVLPYHRVHTYKAQVGKHLSRGALDDVKKAVRAQAVQCRESWSVFKV